MLSHQIYFRSIRSFQKLSASTKFHLWKLFHINNIFQNESFFRINTILHNWNIFLNAFLHQHYNIFTLLSPLKAFSLHTILESFFAPYYFWKLFCSILFSNTHTFLTLFHCILPLKALISFKNLLDILLSIAPHIFNSRSSQFLPPDKANSTVTALDLIIQGRPPLVCLTDLWL